MIPIIAIAGPMGSGKTTLGRSLAFRSGYMFFEERFEENPYLKESTEQQTSMCNNIHWFIRNDYERYKQACDFLEKGIGVIIDKPFFEELTYISLADLTQQQAEIARDLVVKLTKTIKMPDIMIDLQVGTPELSRRISVRGREFEGSISRTWLDAFKEKHEQEMQKLPEIKRLPLNAEIYNFKDEQHIDLIYRKIITELSPKE